MSFLIAGGSLGPIEIGVLANHTLEMIPKSMILTNQLNTCPPPINNRVSAIEMRNESKTNLR